MTKPGDAFQWLRSLAFVVALGLSHTCAAHPAPNTEEHYRFEVLVRLTPAFLLADQSLEQKAAGACYRVGFVFRTMPLADEYAWYERSAEHLRRSSTTLPLCPFPIDVAGLAQLGDEEKVAALLVAADLGDELDTLIAAARALNAISISPAMEDVQRGVCGGMVVTSKVTPYLNRACLEAAGIQLRPFFLGVSAYADVPPAD